MSNKSYPIKENSNVMKVQGGEQKVMKKILTVALSTAMAFSMFASVAFGDSATAVSAQDKFDSLKAKGIFNGYPDGSAHLEKDMTRAEFAKVLTKLLGLKEVTGTLSYKDKGYDAKNWAVPYIEAVTAAGIMEGQDTVKKIFNYNGQVTVQEMATVLTRALKLEVPATTDNSATEWAKGYVQAAIDKGLVSKDLNFQANASRELLVNTSYTIDQLKNISVASYKVVDPSNVEFTLNTGEVVKVKLEKALEANKETEVTFKNAAGQEITTKVTYVVTTATKVESVSATNLKEIVVSYDGTVDKATAENKDAYTVKRGLSVEAVDSAKLQADGKTVVLSVAGAMANQSKEYTLSVDGVKDSEGKASVSVKDKAFVPLDQALPTVDSVTNLGNKAVKITFSEPVQVSGSVASTFKIDDKVVSGTYDVSGRTVTISLFNTLTDGAHNLTVNNNIRDFANYQLVEVTKDFSVTADTVAPTVVETKDATLEGVTLVFSEDVKKAEAETASNYAWFSGATKKVATSAKLIDSNTVRVNFTENRLPGYAVDVVVNNIVDYSGNKIDKDTKVSVTAKLDQVRPEVLSSKFDADARTLTVNFSKTVDKASFKAANLIVKDKDGKVVTNGYTAAYGDNNSKLIITFTKTLATGDYTVELSGVTDVTLLANAMQPYTTSITVTNSAAPNALAITGSGTTYVVTFDKKMDQSSTYSVLNPDNYFITYRTTDAKTISGKLPAATNLAPTSDGKGVIVQLPSGIAAVTSFTVQGVKDVDGNYLANYSKTFNNIGSTVDLVSAKTVAKNKVELKVNQPVASVVGSDFVVTGATVKSATVSTSNNNVIVLTLTGTIAPDATPTVKTIPTLSGATTGVTGAALKVDTTGVVAEDAIAPVVLSANDKVTIGTGAGVDFDGTDTITITYDEDVKALNTVDLQDNIKIERADGISLKKGQDFNAAIVGGKIVVTLVPTAANLVDFDGLFTVAINNSNENIVDLNGNVAAEFSTADAASNQDVLDFQLAPTATGAFSTSDAKVVTVNFSEAVTPATLVAANFVSTAGGAPTIVVASDNKSVTLTYTNTLATGNTVVVSGITDLAGNTIASTTLTK
ncbi:Ig-like domain-containing protein [Paenibacillus dokdonensis]|uniref:Ig-like domain-containing protein n=1 Tax=Paenibacillus dokdonensis TaxID=2567944 RepID=UPI0010A8C2D9|nr:Ig-like domain-containing protein [Paenibacillus dokdonensis]